MTSLRGMMSVIAPIVDSGNPMYCPDVSASQYLRRLRQATLSSRHSDSFVHGLSLSSYDDQSSPRNPSYLEDAFMFRRQKVQNPSILASSTIALPPSPKRKVDEISRRNAHSHVKKRKISHLEPSSSVLSSNATNSRFPALFDAVPPYDSSESNFKDLDTNILSKNISPRCIPHLRRKWKGGC